MTLYLFTTAYASHEGAWAKDEVADLDPATAAWINRDTGAETVVPFVEPETRALEAPQQHRQVTRAPRKRGR